MKEISEAVLAFSTFVKGYCQSFLTPGNGFLIQVLLYTCTGPLRKLKKLISRKIIFRTADNKGPQLVLLFQSYKS